MNLRPTNVSPDIPVKECEISSSKQDVRASSGISACY